MSVVCCVFFAAVSQQCETKRRDHRYTNDPSANRWRMMMMMMMIVEPDVCVCVSRGLFQPLLGPPVMMWQGLRDHSKQRSKCYGCDLMTCTYVCCNGWNWYLCASYILLLIFLIDDFVCGYVWMYVFISICVCIRFLLFSFFPRFLLYFVVVSIDGFK